MSATIIRGRSELEDQEAQRLALYGIRSTEAARRLPAPQIGGGFPARFST